MKILVCGGRFYSNRQYLFDVLTEFHTSHKVTALVNGRAIGADSLAREWAISMCIKPLDYPAKWSELSEPGTKVRYDKFGRPYNAAAGPMRNQKMLDDNPDLALVIAFAGGTGTEDMVSRAKRSQVPVFYVFD